MWLRRRKQLQTAHLVTLGSRDPPKKPQIGCVLNNAERIVMKPFQLAGNDSLPMEAVKECGLLAASSSADSRSESATLLRNPLDGTVNRISPQSYRRETANSDLARQVLSLRKER